MSKPVLFVCKSGSPFYSRSYVRRASSSGEQGETEGVIRHLVSRGDVRVVYFGITYGELPCEVITPAVEGLDEWTDGPTQRDRFRRDEDAVRALGAELLGVINVSGYSPTMSLVDNEKGAQVQSSSIRYTAPMLNLLQAFKLPRVVINNDPRTYPKDQEMSFGWDWVRPRALLDQQQLDGKQVVGGVKYRRNSVWAKCESWGFLERVKNRRDLPCIILGHSHFRTGIKNGGKTREAWDNVMGEHCTYPLYGAGWEGRENWLGPLEAADVPQVLACARCCPVVAHTPRFYTGKPYVLVASGCVPLLYGGWDVPPGTWDPYGHFVPLDSSLRIRKPGDLERLVKWLEDDVYYEAQLETWQHLCQPDWTWLDMVVDRLCSGVELDVEVTGGYERC